MRFAFIDEAGTSQYDPHVVVAAVLIHGDEQLIAIEEHLERLVEKHIPPDARLNFTFHLKEIWSGAKYFKDRKIWPIERRADIMNDLTNIPDLFELPIAFAFKERRYFLNDHPEFSQNPQGADIGLHSIVFTACTAVIEKMMLEIYSEEIAQLVAEDHEQARATIKEVHSYLRDEAKWELANKLANPNVENRALFPLQRIRGGIQFADKHESRPLHIADMCAFFIRGHLRGQPLAEQYYERLKRWMVVLPKGETSPFGKNHF